MSAASARLGAGGTKAGGGGRAGAAAQQQQQPSTSTGGTTAGAAGAGGAATAAAGEDDEEWTRSACSRPSFACDDRALAEMRLAVGTLLEHGGFTHAASSALELLTDVGVRYMRRLAAHAHNAAEMDRRTLATDADVLAGFATMRVNIDEMNEYMRQVRPIAEPRVIPAFPLPIAPTPIVHTAVPAALAIRPPPDLVFPGLPPMSREWLRGEDLEQLLAEEREKENSEAAEREAELEQKRRQQRTMGPEEVKRMLSSYSAGTEAVPSFFCKSASAFGLRKGDRSEDAKRGIGGPLRVEVEDEAVDSRRRPEKRKNAESKLGRIPKHSRQPVAAPAYQDQPGTSTNSFAAALYGGSSCSFARPSSGGGSSSNSRPPSRTPTPSIFAAAAATAGGQPSGPISALRDATRSVPANMPPAGALAPEYASTYTDGNPLRVPGLLAAFGRGGSENRELDRRQQQQQQPSPLARLPPPPAPPPPVAPPSPLQTYETLAKQAPPKNGPPTKLVQLAIMRGLFSRDHKRDEELEIAFATLKASATTEAATTTTKTTTKTTTSSRASGAVAAYRNKKAAAAAREAAATPPPRKSTPLPPPPPAPTTFTPRVTIKPPVKPRTPTPPVPVQPLIVTPLPPLRLKINIGARPSTDTTPSTPQPQTPLASVAVAAAADAYDAATAAFVDDDTSTAGPSSAASTIPLLFSPATAAAAAAAGGEGVQGEEGEEQDGEDGEGKKKKKKHKKEKKEKKEKKHKKHKKSSKEREGAEGGEEGGSRSISRSSAVHEGTVDDAAVPSPATPAAGGPIRLKIRLGPRPTE